MFKNIKPKKLSALEEMEKEIFKRKKITKDIDKFMGENIQTTLTHNDKIIEEMDIINKKDML